MDPTTRWETEALRKAPVTRTSPPKPSRSRARKVGDDVEWVTLKEAEQATGIPTNTLRKWVRRSGLPSFLESDGEMQVRMVDLGAVRARAEALGRAVTPPPPSDGPDAVAGTRPPSFDPPEAATRPSEVSRSDVGRATASEQDAGTMIVPVDAWNKMLTQLGNLHEAGQQLAEARERAAKAETEVSFLRERLAELRAGERPGSPTPTTDPGPPATPEPGAGPSRMAPDPAPRRAVVGEGDTDPSEVEGRVGRRGAPESDETTTYWRYLTTGWRRRKARGSKD